MTAPGYLIAVAGGSGAGKTALVGEIARAMGPENVAIIFEDSYYKDQSHVPQARRHLLNYDQPDALDSALLLRHLEDLLQGRPIAMPVYDFATHTRRGAVPVTPKPLIILDGILLLANEQMRPLLNLKIFVDTDADLRFIRRLRRDVDERGRTPQSVVDQWLATVKPMYDRFVDPSRRYADIVIPGDGNCSGARSLLISHLERVLHPDHYT